MKAQEMLIGNFPGKGIPFSPNEIEPRVSKVARPKVKVVPPSHN